MKSFIPWVGGKSLLASKIVERFPENIARYIEVFGGGASVLFARDKHAPLEVYNDKNGQLVNLFRCVKFHPEELRREISMYLNSREAFNNCLELMTAPGFTDIQRAARFFMVIRCSFGTKLGDFFGGAEGRLNNLTTSTDCFQAIQKRLISEKSVVIENKDFQNLIRGYDRKNALFYCDPPYYGTEKMYTEQFPKEDHTRLYQALSTIKGKFILSYNDCPFIRDLYKDYTIESVSRSNNLSSGEYKELIIRNF